MKDYVRVTNPIVGCKLVGYADDEITLDNTRAAWGYLGETAATCLRRLRGSMVVWKFVKGSLYVHREFVRAYELN